MPGNPSPPPPLPPAPEYRISVYGRKPVEWDTLAAWVVQNRLYSDNNVWMIQVGRGLGWVRAVWLPCPWAWQAEVAVERAGG